MVCQAFFCLFENFFYPEKAMCYQLKLLAQLRLVFSSSVASTSAPHWPLRLDFHSITTGAIDAPPILSLRCLVLSATNKNGPGTIASGITKILAHRTPAPSPPCPRDSETQTNIQKMDLLPSFPGTLWPAHLSLFENPPPPPPPLSASAA